MTGRTNDWPRWARSCWRLSAAILAAGTVVAACGDDDDAAPREPPRTVPSTASSTASTAQTTSDPLPLDEVELSLTEVATADTPTALVPRPGTTSLYVAERAGRVREITVEGDGDDRTYAVADRPLLDITEEVVTEGEKGLLDIEFSPDGATLYVSYSVAPNGDSRIVSYAMAGDRIDESSEREVLVVEQPGANNHKGGDIEFGPDGYLYFALGDGGGSGDRKGNGQNTDTLLGKLLRIDVAQPAAGTGYGIPSDNPFADGAGGRSEIWIYGVRNPWRFSFDRATGDLWVADVGQDEWEEINLLPAAGGGGRAANLGWNLLEGTHSFEGDNPADGVLPVFEYSHDEGCSITGGVVYRGSDIPGLAGAYLFGDLCGGTIRALRAPDGKVSEQRAFDGVEVDQLVSFAEDTEGEVFVLSIEGPIYRLDGG